MGKEKKSVHKNWAGLAQHHTEVAQWFWSEEALLPAHSLMLPHKASSGDAWAPLALSGGLKKESTKENWPSKNGHCPCPFWVGPSQEGSEEIR